MDPDPLLFPSPPHGDPRSALGIEEDEPLRLGDRPLAVLGPGEIFGEMALVEEAPRSATAVALEECRIAFIDRKRFLFLVQNTPYFSLRVMKIMAARLRGMDEKFLELEG